MISYSGVRDADVRIGTCLRKKLRGPDNQKCKSGSVNFQLFVHTFVMPNRLISLCSISCHAFGEPSNLKLITVKRPSLNDFTVSLFSFGTNKYQCKFIRPHKSISENPSHLFPHICKTVSVSILHFNTANETDDLLILSKPHIKILTLAIFRSTILTLRIESN